MPHRSQSRSQRVVSSSRKLESSCPSGHESSPKFEGSNEKASVYPFFSFDGRFATLGSFRPPVWTGAGNPEAGLLGFQAPAADGLVDDPAETCLPAAPGRLTRLPEPSPLLKGKTVYKPIPRLPAEIHFQILSNILSSFPEDGCSYCYLFRLSSLTAVSTMYHSLLQSHLYSTVRLGCITISCEEHFKLSSRHKQLSKRIPLLLRTLSVRRDIAATVKKLVLPSSGLSSYLTCELEKTHLPALIRLCPNLEEIQGFEDLLERQFFAGEHHCLDGEDPQQHGIVAQTIIKKSSLKKWQWISGSASGYDFWQRVWDCHPMMGTMDFVDMHSNWTSLSEIAIVDVWGLSEKILAGVLSKLCCLQKVTIIGARRKHSGHGDSTTILAGLESLPNTVSDITVGDVADERFIDSVGSWVKGRYGNGKQNPLERLAVIKAAIVPEALWNFIATLCSGFVLSTRDGSLLFSPLSNIPQRRQCCVKKLGLNNEGFESLYPAADLMLGSASGGVEGLEQLEWGIRLPSAAPDLAGLGTLVDGLHGLKQLVLSRQLSIAEDFMVGVQQRGVEIVLG